MENTNTLQEKINKRAETKLKEKLNSINRFLSDTHYTFLNDSGNVKIMNGDKEEVVDAKYIFSASSPIYEKVFAKRLPEFIEEETKLFLQEIEDLKIKVADVQNGVENLQNY